MNYNQEMMAKAFDSLEQTLFSNIANHIIQYTFHKNSTEEELVAYYGGSHVNREKLQEDTISRLVSDQMVLRFLLDNKKEIYEYTQKDPTGNLGITLQRASGVGIEPHSISADATEDEPESRADETVRRKDDGNEDGNSTEPPRGNGEGAGLGETATLGVRSNDEGSGK